MWARLCGLIEVTTATMYRDLQKKSVFPTQYLCGDVASFSVVSVQWTYLTSEPDYLGLGKKLFYYQVKMTWLQVYDARP